MPSVLITRNNLGTNIQYFRNRTYLVDDNEAKRLVSRRFGVVVSSVRGTNTDPVPTIKEERAEALQLDDLFAEEPEEPEAETFKVRKEDSEINSGLLLGCNQCDKKFPSQRGLQAHKDRVHNKKEK